MNVVPRPGLGLLGVQARSKEAKGSSPANRRGTGRGQDGSLRARSIAWAARPDRPKCGGAGPCAHAEPAPNLAQTHHESSPWLAAHRLQRIPDWRVRWRAHAPTRPSRWVQKSVLRRRTSDRWTAPARWAVDLSIRRYV